MKEINRQLVIFGNFNSFTFESVMKLSRIRENYNFQINAMPDIIRPKAGQAINVMRGDPVSRPLFQSIDKKITVFFGTERIHIEEVDGDSATYDKFNEMAVDIICEIINTFNLSVKKIAINGNIFKDDKEGIQRTFDAAFKDSKWYTGQSDEWSYRIASKDFVPELSCEVTKIVNNVRGIFLDNLNNTQNGVIAGYDFNTLLNEEKEFSNNDIKTFNRLAKEYRKLFL